MIPFDEVRFPEDIVEGAQGGPTFSTSVIVSTQGREFRNRLWRRARHKFEVSHALIDFDLAQDLFAFFLARGGKQRGFRLKWPRDFETGDTHQPCQPLSATVFQLQKIYTSGSVSYNRTIHKPVESTVRIFSGGSEILSGWTCDFTTGRVTFDSAPGYLPGAIFEFDLPVRFNIDNIAMQDSGITGDWPRVPLVEVLFANPALSLDPIAGFVEARFPDNISDGASGGPRFATTIIAAESGAETSEGKWTLGRHVFDVSHAMRDPDEADALTSFFYCRAGRHQGFRFKYWRDYTTGPLSVETFQETVPINTTQFQLTKHYGTDFPYARKITKPVVGSVHVFNLAHAEITDGFTVDTTTGLVNFDSPPGFTPTAAFEFDIPVRFDTDEMQMTDESSEVYSWSQIPIVEILS